MIDDDRTAQIYGYTSLDLSKGSSKKVVAVCDECGKYRIIRMQSYRELCVSCVQIGTTWSLGSRQKHAEAYERMSPEKKDRMSRKGLPGHQWVPGQIDKFRLTTVGKKDLKKPGSTCRMRRKNGLQTNQNVIKRVWAQ